jgi:hypothetical protein
MSRGGFNDEITAPAEWVAPFPTRATFCRVARDVAREHNSRSAV